MIQDRNSSVPNKLSQYSQRLILFYGNFLSVISVPQIFYMTRAVIRQRKLIKAKTK